MIWLGVTHLLRSRDYIFTIIGSIFVGLSYNLFLLPSKLAAGGISGVSTILFELFKLEPFLTQFLINIPIFIAGWFILGRSFSIKTAVATFLVPLSILLSKDVVEKGTHDPLLGAIYGGIMLGFGLGLVYRGNGSTGGTATISQIVKKYTGLSSGYSQMIVDAIVVTMSAFVFNFELALYALICIYVTSKVIDFVQLHSSDNKLVLIITNDEASCTNLIHNTVQRGVTKLAAFGGYLNGEKSLLLSVMEQKEAIYLKQSLLRDEPDAFVIFVNASDIIGSGFSRDKIFKE